VISDCEKVEVAYEAANRVVNAIPTTYSAKADLVLLQIKDASQEKPM